ncbi:hypothetical protein [Litorihabitans aurantiacus]|uniref:Uncharacterized protein n=1 Tax=Litorihabitans aurantiacus TaxID=1930061 RepID=A0AA38CTB4_9MICO|nr:hypothetical protein [Litorihabitans aurantiacus]GMA31692.1 hypothetical protein GCM10025875_16840 [Litorihabitans aurantiacus]
MTSDRDQGGADDPDDLSHDLPDGVVVPDDLSSLFGDDGGASSAPGLPDTADASDTAADTSAAGTAGGATPSTSAPASGTAEEDAADDDVEPAVIRTTAVVLTQVRQAKVLASILALAGIEAAVVPSGRGAIAVRYVEQLEADADPGELLSGIPREAEALGAALSVAARSEVVLLAARVEEVSGEISGQVKARRYRGGQIAQEPPPGLVLAQADAVAERLLIGLVQAPQVPGYISSSDLGGAGGAGGGGVRGLFGRRRRDEGETS